MRNAKGHYNYDPMTPIHIIVLEHLVYHIDVRQVSTYQGLNRRMNGLGTHKFVFGS